MRTFDLTPLFRSTVGFDRLASMMDHVTRDAATYPPYNIEKIGDDAYRIVMAVAGFNEDDIEITFQQNQLTIVGHMKDSADKESVQYLHRGIANRAFEHKFQLADHIRVGQAEMKNGLLVVHLTREIPEALRPRTIPIGSSSNTSSKVIDADLGDKKKKTA